MWLRGVKKLVDFRGYLLFLVIYEMFQRFSFYGFQGIVFLYLKHELELKIHNAIGIYHLYVGLSCLVPIFGTLIADLYMNKVYSLLLMGAYATVGNILIIVASSASEEWNDTKDILDYVWIIVALGLFARALGGGGSREIVRSLGEEHFLLPDEVKNLLSFHQLLYYFMTFGTIMAFLIPPVLRMHLECFGMIYCFPAAFGFPAAILLLGMVALMAGYSRLRPHIPRSSVLIEFFLCIVAALSNLWGGGKHWVDNASHAYVDDFLDDMQDTLAVLWLFLPLPMFWALYEQAGSRWVHQATHMKGTLSRDTNWYVEPDNMQVIIPITIFIVMPVFEYLLYPFIEKWNFLRTPKQRMFCGSVLAILAFITAALVELQNEPTHARERIPGEGGFAVYNFMGMCEIEVTTNFPNLGPFIVGPLSQQIFEYLPVKGIVPMTFHIKEHSSELYPCGIKGLDYKGNTSLAENHTVGVAHLYYVISPQANAHLTLTNPIDGLFSPSLRCDLQLPRVGIIYYTGYPFDAKTAESQKTDESIIANEVILLGHWKYHGHIRKYLDHNHQAVDYFHAKPTNYDLTRPKATMNDTRRYIGLSRGEVGTIMVKPLGENIMQYNYTRILHPLTVPMWWVMPQYILISMAAFMFPYTMLEYSYSQVRWRMKPIITSCWLISIALGNFLVSGISFANIFVRELYYYVLFAFLMLPNCALLWLVLFKYIPPREAKIERESQTGASGSYSSASTSSGSSGGWWRSGSGSRSSRTSSST